jgi:hypothetical protein
MRKAMPILIAFLSLQVPGVALADTCDISEFKDYMSYHKDILTNLSYVERVASREDRSKGDSADIAIADYGSFTYADAAKLTASLESILDIKWSQEDQETLLTSSLSGDGLKAYTSCIQNAYGSLVVSLSDSASNSDEFFVDYVWKPTYTAPNPATMHILLSNATSESLPSKIKTPSSDSFHVKRTSMYKPLDISVHVDGQPYPTITLPAFPDKKLQKQIRQTSELNEVYGGGNSLSKRLCVTLDNSEQDAVIVPNTIQNSMEPSIQERASMIQGPSTYNSREACTTFVWHLEAGDGHVKGKATIEALVLKAVPAPAIEVTRVVGETPMFNGQ